MHGWRGRRVRLGLAMVLLAGHAWAQEGRTLIGVMNFHASGVEQNIARQASEALCAALVQTRAVAVLDQSGILEQFMVDVARQSERRRTILEAVSGEGCTSTECLADIGAELEAQFMVTGRVERVGGEVEISARMVHVASARILAYANARFAWDTKRLRDVEMPRMADALIQALSSKVMLRGLPRDATVLIDGEPVLWQPDRPLAVPPGPHRLLARRPGFHDASELTVIEYRHEFSDPLEIDLGMRSKSLAGAVARSFVFPGWGQFYGDRPVRGTLYLVGELAMAGAVAYTWLMNQQANDDYEAAKKAYVELSGPDATQTALDDHHRQMQDEWDNTRSTRTYHLAAWGALAGLHLLNFLDAGVGFPSLSAVRMASLSDDASGVGIQIALAKGGRR